MRLVTFGVANSLDNFIAREDGAVDWLVWDDEVAAISRKFWKTIDTVLMGRKTYEVAAAGGSGAYPGVKNYVFSRTLKQPRSKKVEMISQDAVEFVRKLKSQPGKGICIIGGGELARSLLQARLIDQIGVNIQPVLLGSGVPLFYEMQQQLDLELLE
ncbi:MAG TPA: dihydrofolate reductase, partial [Pyrinomonadaceae bacterium]|nr:dihydrofolate reductase [Pyrinomonadaceae bacterium]